MNDNDIIKALECLGGNSTLCQQCAYDQLEFPRCKENCAKDALYIITCQNANIEALEMDNSRLRYKYKMAVEEREANMKGFLEELNRWNKEIQEARAETIKEFAAELKKHSRMPLGTLYGEMVYVEAIDNLAKEMERERE